MLIELHFWKEKAVFWEDSMDYQLKISNTKRAHFWVHWAVSHLSLQISTSQFSYLNLVYQKWGQSRH